MRFLVHYGKTFTVLLILFPLLGLSASYLYLKYEQTKEDVLIIVQNNMLEEKKELLANYIDHLQSEHGDGFVEILKQNEALRQQAEEGLSLIKSSEVQYLYCLYVDKKARLRYLLDTTKDIKEKGEFKQRFFPQKQIWKKAQEEQTVQTASQQDIDKLWISMAYPIINEDKTVALIGIDFSHEEHLRINNTLIPLKKMYLYSAIFVVVMFISAFVQLIIYYKHRKKSFIDPLTGMYNRHYLHALLKKFPLGKFQILIMDLDHFKKVNDLHGHDSGDIVLKTVAQRILSVIGKNDLLIRYGGEEFLLLISGQDKEAALALAEKIRHKVKAEPITLENCTLNISVSMGLNSVTYHFKSFESAVKVADECLYRAKHLGRDRLESYDDKSIGNEDALQQLCDVKDALDLDQVFCVYQPIVHTSSLEVKRYELLVRMVDKHGDRKSVV